MRGLTTTSKRTGFFGLILGTIDGQLSADGSQVSISLKFAQYNATWNARPQF